ncbi:MAG: hypothetical protein ACI4MM_00810 [Candidatus Ventricola sp.]
MLWISCGFVLKAGTKGGKRVLGLIAAVYLLLALRLRLTADASLCGENSSLSLSAGAAGVELRFDGVLRRGENRFSLHMTPRYGAPLRLKAPAKLRVRQLRSAWPYGLAVLQAGRLEQVTLHARIGLEDAGETAVAAGAVRALLLSLPACLGAKAPCDLRIMPDFGGVGLAAHGRCIFSCQAGDIMFAVIKTAVRKTGREGFGWKSIPLRA